jgi:hypothetical protein
MLAKYSVHGYGIFDDTGELVYSAGNHFQDSQVHTVDKRAMLSLSTIRQYAKNTLSEFDQNSKTLVKDTEFLPECYHEQIAMYGRTHGQK